jgi:hypothetical protein
MYSNKDVKRSTLTAAVLLALSAGTAYSSVNDTGTTNNDFTMISSAGGLQGGNNTTAFIWDGTLKTTVVTDGSSNATLSSITKFSGFLWTAHHINVYGPGTYVFDATCASGNPSCGTGTAAQKYTLVVPAGYIGAHMLFNWSTSSDIDVLQLWKINDSWDATGGDPVGSATSSDPFCGESITVTACTSANSNGNTRNTVWSLVSVDTPSSTIDAGAAPTSETNINHGTKMIDGPFIGSQANFNVMVDTAPDAFTFTDQTGVATSTVIESAAITLSKAGATGTPVFTISVTGGEYSIGTGGVYAAYTSDPSVITTAQTVKVRHTSSSSACGTADTTLTIGGVNDTFSTTATGVACSDTRPNGFTLTATTGVALSSTVTSNTITVTGITAAIAVDISVTGDASSQYSVNGGAYTSAAGTVVLNDTVTVRHTSAATNNTATSTVLHIGGVSDATNSVTGTFTSTTVAAASTAPTTADAPSGAGGCSISSKPVSAVERGDWWLVAGLLAWLGVIRARFKRQAQS